MDRQDIRRLIEAGFLLTTVALSPLSGAQAGGHPHKKGAATSGIYRNLLKERGHDQAAIDARIASSFQQLFHGDPQSQAIYYAVGSNENGPLAYVTDVANHDARTEGMSYGMMVAVQANHKTEFDALWNWANTYMLITDPKNPSVGYYAWSMNVDGTPRSDSPAPDGEEYFAMSLYFAANRWGNGKGIYDYRAQADRILHEMRHHEVQTGIAPYRIHPQDTPFEPRRRVDPTTRTTKVGPIMNEEYSMIDFVPTFPANEFSDPSYHLPAFYELWARWGPVEDRAFWAHAAEVSRQYFVQVANTTTGLSPDYSNFDGSPRRTAFNPHSGDFSYDSWRVVSNWSVDQSWWAANPRARMLSDRLQGFLFKQGIHSFADQYTLDGKAISTRHSTGMVATNAVGSLAATDGPVARAFVDELWNTPVPSGEQRYYDGLLYMMSLLHTSGQFRVWGPLTATERMGKAR
jgi:oligosaccharide reducing-end xylanase